MVGQILRGWTATPFRAQESQDVESRVPVDRGRGTRPPGLAHGPGRIEAALHPPRGARPASSRWADETEKTGPRLQWPARRGHAPPGKAPHPGVARHLAREDH